MSKSKLESEIRKRANKLEEFSMTHEDACGFISGIMNLGKKKKKKMNERK